MNGKLYRFLKVILEIMMLLSCVLFAFSIFYFLYMISNGADISMSKIVNKAYSLILLLMSMIVLRLFLKLLKEIEVGKFRKKSISISNKIGKIFLLAAILVSIPYNLEIDKSGFGILEYNDSLFSILGVNITFLSVLLIFNCLTFTLIPFLIDRIIEVTEENKYII